MNARFGLSSDVIHRLWGVFRQYPGIRRVVIYGSRATGKHRPNSDIDITLEGESLTGEDLARIEGQLDDLLLPYKIDLSIMNQIDNPALLEHIRQYGQKL